jgi:aryl-alcohol dehydrogenase-like predicted oxidoreductase
MTRHGGPGAPEATAEALQEIRRVCDEAGLDMAKVALAWLLRQPGVTTVIAGARNPEQIRANARAAELALPDDVVDALTAATEPLKRELGPNLDMWEPASNSRIR